MSSEAKRIGEGSVGIGGMGRVERLLKRAVGTIGGLNDQLAPHRQDSPMNDYITWNGERRAYLSSEDD